nr:MAG TPA: hypothetical protein [Caudoviricetes sp.]
MDCQVLFENFLQLFRFQFSSSFFILCYLYDYILMK